jgi:Hemerythrin HHE cation binding domain
MDLWQLIGSYRSDILRLARRVAGSGDGRGTGREKMFRELVREVERYMGAMESVVHPALANDPRTRSYVADLEQEHAEIRRALAHLGAFGAKDTREWSRRHAALIFALEHYFSLQEHGAFTVARGALADHTDALRRAFEREQAAALQAQRWHVPIAMAPARYGVPAGTAIGVVLGVLSLAVAAVAWRQKSAPTRRDAGNFKDRLRHDREDRERQPAWVH